MGKRVSESERLDRVLAMMRLLQSHLEEANFDVTEFEEVEIFLDLAAGCRRATPATDLRAGRRSLLQIDAISGLSCQVRSSWRSRNGAEHIPVRPSDNPPVGPSAPDTRPATCHNGCANSA